MAYYHKLGKIPSKRHTQFRQPDGSLYAEEVVSSKGFTGIYSILYHTKPPTAVQKVDEPYKFGPEVQRDYPLLQTHLNTSKVGFTGKDYLDARKLLLMNNDIAFGICNPEQHSSDYYYKNAE